MSAATGVGTAGHGPRVPWGDVVMSALAAVFFFAADQLIAMGVRLILGLGA